MEDNLFSACGEDPDGFKFKEMKNKFTIFGNKAEIANEFDNAIKNLIIKDECDIGLSPEQMLKAFEEATPKPGTETESFGAPMIFGIAGEIKMDGFEYFAENFKVIGPDGKIPLTDSQKKEIEYYAKMSKTHTPQLIKLRRGGTSIVWKLKADPEKLTE